MCTWLAVCVYVCVCVCMCVRVCMCLFVVYLRGCMCNIGFNQCNHTFTLPLPSYHSYFAQSPNITTDRLCLHGDCRLADAQDEIARLRIKCGLVDDYERRVQSLKDQLYLSSLSKPAPRPLPLSEPRYVGIFSTPPCVILRA